MTELLLYSALLLLVAYFAGCVLGSLIYFLLRRKPRPRTDQAVSIADAPLPSVPAPAPVMTEYASDYHDLQLEDETAEAKLAALPRNATNMQKADAVGTRPIALETAPASPDDLKKISGIGKVNERKLNDLGIYRFEQIAGWGVSETQWVNTYLSFPGRIERENWVEQAVRLVAASHQKDDADPAKARIKDKRLPIEQKLLL